MLTTAQPRRAPLTALQQKRAQPTYQGRRLLPPLTSVVELEVLEVKEGRGLVEPHKVWREWG